MTGELHWRQLAAQARAIVASCSYPGGGRAIDRLRDMANGYLDDTFEDPELAQAVRDAAGVALFEDPDR